MFLIPRLKRYGEYLKSLEIFHSDFESRVNKKIILLCTNIIFANAGVGILVPVLPEIQAWGNITTVQLGILVSVFAFARIAANIPAGYVSDNYKGNKPTLIGMSILLVGSLLSASAPSFVFLVIGRVISGLGSSLALVSIQTELLSLGCTDHRSKLMSYFMISHRAGASIFPFIGGALAMFFTWRAVFLFCTLLNLIGIIFVLSPIMKNNESSKETNENLGLTTKTGGKASSSHEALNQNEKPLLFFVLCIIASMMFLNRGGLERTILPVYGNIIGLNSLQLGIIFSISSIVSLVAIYGGGYFADRYSRKLIFQVGLVVLILANGIFLFVSSFWGFLVAKLLFGIAAFTTALPLIIATDSVHPSRMGRTLSTVRLFNDLGTVTGPIALGWVMDFYSFSATIYVSVIILAISTLMVGFFLEDTTLKNLNVAKNKSSTINN